MPASDILLVRREGEFSYPILLREDFSGLAKAVSRYVPGKSAVCLVADSNVSALYMEEVRRILETVFEKVTCFVFPAGEENKNLATVQRLYHHLIENGIDRGGLLAALGGGVTGDLTGFAAATYLRGIDFIQIPTTLLAQVDSSVGGKTGVDFDQYKNMVGAFYQPGLVYMNLGTLRTLPDEQFSCGMGEVLKTGLIRDGEFFRSLIQGRQALLDRDYQALSGAVRRCCEIKAEIVERDPKEKGERALLNLGHTIGHAIEKLKNFSLLHGQCVAIGLAAAAVISRNRGMLSETEVNTVKEACLAFSLPVQTDGLTVQEILDATKKDKKMLKGSIRFILMDGIGKSVVCQDVTEEEIRSGIEAVLA